MTASGSVGGYAPLDEVGVTHAVVEAARGNLGALERLTADLRYHRRLAAHMTRRAVDLEQTLRLAGGGEA